MKTRQFTLAAASLTAAALALGATPALARSAKAPALANTAAISGSVTGTTDPAAPFAISGSLDLVVAQVVSPGVAIGMANLELPTGITLAPGASVVVTSQEDGSSVCAGTPVVEQSGRSITVKGLGCSDSDADSRVEFTVSVTGLSGTATLAAGSYPVKSQFRSNPTRRLKENAWITSNPTAVVIAPSTV